MEVEEHLEGLRQAMVAFVRGADRAGLTAPVPTTPGWSVRDLVVHQGVAHRRTAALFGGRSAPDRAYEEEGRAAGDPLDWARDGAIEAATRLSLASDATPAPVFLPGGGTPRRFWARRLCHETTLHAVDAAAAHLGRYPVSADVDWISDEVALDGIDELLTGFVPRPVSRLRPEEEQSILVRVGAAGPRWLLDLGPHVPRVSRGGGREGADVLLTGSPRALYLALWNRSDELDASWLGDLRAG